MRLEGWPAITKLSKREPRDIKTIQEPDKIVRLSKLLCALFLACRIDVASAHRAKNLTIKAHAHRTQYTGFIWYT